MLDKGFSINETVTTQNSGSFVDSMGVEQYVAPGFSADLLAAKHNRDSAKRGGMWAYGGAFEPLHSPVDGYSINGASPLMPLEYFVEN